MEQDGFGIISGSTEPSGSERISKWGWSHYICQKFFLLPDCQQKCLFYLYKEEALLEIKALEFLRAFIMKHLNLSQTTKKLKLMRILVGLTAVSSPLSGKSNPDLRLLWFWSTRYTQDPGYCARKPQSWACSVVCCAFCKKVILWPSLTGPLLLLLNITPCLGHSQTRIEVRLLRNCLCSPVTSRGGSIFVLSVWLTLGQAVSPWERCHEIFLRK